MVQGFSTDKISLWQMVHTDILCCFTETCTDLKRESISESIHQKMSRSIYSTNTKMMKKITYCLFWLLIIHSAVFAQSDSLTVEHVQHLEEQLLDLHVEFQAIQTSIIDLTENFEGYVEINNENNEQLRDDFSSQAATLQSLTEQLENLRNASSSLQTDVSDLTDQLNETDEKAVELSAQIERANEEIETVAGQLRSDIEQTSLQADEQYAMLGQSLSRNTVYWMIS